MAAGVYAILLGNNFLPSKEVRIDKENLEERNSNRIQYTIAGIILVYFGISNLYSVLM